MVESSQSTSTNGAHTKHSMPAHSIKIQMGGRNSSIELLRIIAMFTILMHHFIVHNGYDVKTSPPGTRTCLFPIHHAGRRQSRCRHLLLHLSMVLPRQGTDHQIQSQTRVDHGTRTPVLESHAHDILFRIRSYRPQHMAYAN